MNESVKKFAEVKVVEEFTILSVKFLGFVSHKDFLPIVEYEYDLIRQYQISKCYIDLRLIPVHGKGSPEYVKDVWFPTVAALGVRYVAFVQPEAALGKMTMRSAHDGVESAGSLHIENFTDPDEAMRWLRTC